MTKVITYGTYDLLHYGHIRLLERAKALNSERVVLVAPGGTDEEGEAVSGLSLAAAVAGAIAGTTDPALPLGGAVLSGLYGLETTYGDNDLDLLIRGGVTPAERTGGVTSVVRGVTTRTTTDGTADTTWRELSTILVVDDVISTGGSLKALDALAEQTQCTIVGQAAVLAEGDAAERKDIIFLEPLPLFFH